MVFVRCSIPFVAESVTLPNWNHVVLVILPSAHCCNSHLICKPSLPGMGVTRLLLSWSRRGRPMVYCFFPRRPSTFCCRLTPFSPCAHLEGVSFHCGYLALLMLRLLLPPLLLFLCFVLLLLCKSWLWARSSDFNRLLSRLLLHSPILAIALDHLLHTCVCQGTGEQRVGHSVAAYQTDRQILHKHCLLYHI